MSKTVDEFMTWCEVWQDTEYAALSVLVSALVAVARVHQVNHWQASGEPYYGDHLLFERLYNAVNEEIDVVAEKAVGFGSYKAVDATKQLAQAAKIIEQLSNMNLGVPLTDDLVNSSLDVELFVLELIDVVKVTLKANKKLSLGIDNMLAGIADKHESHVYLLRRRSLRDANSQ